MRPAAAIETARPGAFDRSYSTALHGLRGVAAVSVFINHFFDFLAQPGSVLAPLHWLDNGLAAVSLFFILSGTVLGISLRDFRSAAGPYAGYVVKRVFRLTPMIIVSCTIGFLYSQTVPGPAADGILAAEFYRFYQAPLNLGQLLFSWTGLYAAANPPMWSIYVEIVASALLPCFVLCSHRLRGCALLCGALLLLSFAMSGVDGHFSRNHWPVYLVNFATGLLLCHLGRSVSKPINRMPAGLYALTVAGFYLLLMNGRTVLALGPIDSHGNAAANLFDLLVSAILVLLLMERRSGAASIPARFLGDISYPLYLLHWPVLCILLSGTIRYCGPEWIMAHGEAWTVSTFLGAGAVLILLSWLCFRWIERPAIALGRRLADRVARPRAPLSDGAAAVLTDHAGPAPQPDAGYV